MFRLNWTVNITFVRALTRLMTSRNHDEQYSAHMYAIYYAQTLYSRTCFLRSLLCNVLYSREMLRQRKQQNGPFSFASKLLSITMK